MKPTDGLLLTTDEAATYLRLAKQTLVKWRSQGVGPRFIKLGERVLYHHGEIEAWLSRHTITPKRDKR